jgi:hypothetical protein
MVETMETMETITDTFGKETERLCRRAAKQ